MILIDNVKVEFGVFPNNERYLNYNKITFHNSSVVVLKFETDQDLMDLYILRSYMNDVIPNNIMTLKILYMPYSRMDRANNTYTFNLKYICDMINAMHFARVKVVDAHSDVSTALLNRCTNISIIPALMALFVDKHGMDNTILFYPDAGAEKRYSHVARYPSAVGSKERDFKTGDIIKYSVSGTGVKGKKVLIVDDLCSKGGTFIAAAEALKSHGAANIYLMVAHCEHTIFSGKIFTSKLIDEVYTTNSIMCNSTALENLIIHQLYTEVKRDA